MKPISLFLLCVLLAGCDPMRYIELQKNKDPNKSVVIYGTERLNRQEAHNGKSVIALKPNEETTTVRYAFGKWDDVALNETSQVIDSIVLFNNPEKKVLIAKEDIRRFLKQHRNAVYRNGIEIKNFKW